VLQAGANVTLVGMDITMTTLLSTGMIDEVAREGDEAAKVLMRMAEFYVGSYKTMYPGIEGCGCTIRWRSPSPKIPAWQRRSACWSTSS
jgi:purine nucleosidase